MSDRAAVTRRNSPKRIRIVPIILRGRAILFNFSAVRRRLRISFGGIGLRSFGILAPVGRGLHPTGFSTRSSAAMCRSVHCRLRARASRSSGQSRNSPVVFRCRVIWLRLLPIASWPREAVRRDPHAPQECDEGRWGTPRSKRAGRDRRAWASCGSTIFPDPKDRLPARRGAHGKGRGALRQWSDLPGWAKPRRSSVGRFPSAGPDRNRVAGGVFYPPRRQGFCGAQPSSAGFTYVALWAAASCSGDTIADFWVF